MIVGLQINTRGWMYTAETSWINLNCVEQLVEDSIFIAGIKYKCDQLTAMAIRNWIHDGNTVDIRPTIKWRELIIENDRKSNP